MVWMSVDRMRAEIIKVYPGRVGWALKVCDMPDEQVAAIYKRMLRNGQIKKDPVKVEKKADNPERGLRAKGKFFDDEYSGEQIRFKI